MKVSTYGPLVACVVLAASGLSAQSTTVSDRISAAVRDIRLIDVHEHLSAESERLKIEPSLFNLLHYVSSDMWADGMDRQEGNRTLGRASVPLSTQWELVAPYWANVRTTAYGRSLLRAVRDLYGIDDISESTYEEISRKIREANRPGWYRHVLKDRAGIEVSISDIGRTGAALDPDLFRAVLRLDHFLLVPQGPASVAREQGAAIESLADWETALERAFVSAREKGFVGIKSAVAYERPLEFAAVDRAAAEAIFNQAKTLAAAPGPADWTRHRALQDYMFGRIADLCARHDLPLQIHTGFFFDTWRDVRQASPALLVPFIARHKTTRFVLMHAGYPYGSELLAMAKNLPNVTIDMSWAYIISPTFAHRFLNEAIETVPADKILAFGGDYEVPEGAYAHAMLCREVVAKVLTDKVNEGYWSEAEALRFARAILRENAIRTFRLGL